MYIFFAVKQVLKLYEPIRQEPRTVSELKQDSSNHVHQSIYIRKKANITFIAIISPYIVGDQEEAAGQVIA